ncbi:MAG: BadF/BadG/BcrA/BcrD ATPase family protein [Acidobacteriota bacterium]
MTEYFVGLDGGGSKTSAVLVNDRFEELGHGLSGPSNYLRVGIAEATDSVATAVEQALRTSGLAPDQVKFTYCGIAGSDHPRHRERLVEALRHLFPRNNFTVDSDASIALTAGVGFGPGVVVIAGTGSVAFGRNETNDHARAGGWGPTLGDEGSAYTIGRRGLSAVARSFDGRGPKTIITDVLCNRYRICDPQDLPWFIYSPTTHASDIAVHCRTVIEAAEKGDPIAVEILREEGSELGLTVVAVGRRLHMLEDGFPVAYVGGVFRAGALIIDPLMEILREHCPSATLVPAPEEPAMGAARMAAMGAVNARPSRQP